jgi:hypothetical protein
MPKTRPIALPGLLSRYEGRVIPALSFVHQMVSGSLFYPVPVLLYTVRQTAYLNFVGARVFLPSLKSQYGFGAEHAGAGGSI